MITAEQAQKLSIIKQQDDIAAELREIELDIKRAAGIGRRVIRRIIHSPVTYTAVHSELKANSYIVETEEVRFRDKTFMYYRLTITW